MDEKGSAQPPAAGAVAHGTLVGAAMGAASIENKHAATSRQLVLTHQCVTAPYQRTATISTWKYTNTTLPTFTRLPPINQRITPCRGVRAIIGGSYTGWYGPATNGQQAGGVSYVGSFGSLGTTQYPVAPPCFIFSAALTSGGVVSPKMVWDTVSHGGF